MTNIKGQYRIGNATITRVAEKPVISFSPSFLFPNWDPSVLNRHTHLFDYTQEPDHGNVIVSVHTWVIEFDTHKFLIDTGIGNDKDRPFNQLFHRLQTPFLEQLESIGVRPEEVDYILMTHLHADHVGWNTRFVDGCWIPTFPNAKYVFPQAEQIYYTTPASESRRVVFEDSVAPVIAAKQSVSIPDQGGEYLEGIVFHPTPGHSVGHMAISIKSQGEEAFFIGDIAHHPIQIHEPQLNSVFCADTEKSRESRRWMLKYAADHRATVFPAHFHEPSAGLITYNNNEFEWHFI